MKYQVIIEETVSDTFSVEADTPQQALEAVALSYKMGQLVLEPGEVEQAQAAVYDNDGVSLVPFTEI